MKILFLNTSERAGGAAVAANRLMQALQKQGTKAKMLVRDKQTDNTSIVSVNTSYINKKLNYLRFVWERLIIFICNIFLSQTTSNRCYGKITVRILKCTCQTSFIS